MFSKLIYSAASLFLFAVAPDLYAANRSNGLLKGAYVLSGQGFVPTETDISPARFAPFAQIGLVVYDGHGNISSGSFTLTTVPGSFLSPSDTFTGTYSVSPDCSGWATVVFSGGSTFTLALVVQSPRKHMLLDSTPADEGSLITVYTAERVRTSDTD